MTDQLDRNIEIVDFDFILATEAKMQETFGKFAGLETGLVDTACALLVRTLELVRPGEGKLTLVRKGVKTLYDQSVLTACALMGAHALRVIRAARAVLASGFEAEARAYDRILVELMAHREAILDDPAGAEARAWLDRERIHGVTKRVAEMTDAELYGNLSMVAHGDPAAVSSVLNTETNTIRLGPHRGLRTRMSLIIYAGFARDQAHLVSLLSGAMSIADLASFDAAYNIAWDRLAPAVEGFRGDS